MKQLKHVLTFAALALLAALAVLLWQGVHQNQAKQAYLTAYASRLNPLLAQRTGLEIQLSALQGSILSDAIGTGSMTLVCLSPDERVYTELYPLLQEKGFGATVVLSPDALPGTPGNMTAEAFAALCEAGWEPCLAWDGVTDLGEWLAPVQVWLETNKLAMPQAVYLLPSRYSTDLDAALQEYGITTVLHHGEDGLSLTTESAEETPWRIGVTGWNATGANDRASALASAGGATALAVDFATTDATIQYQDEQYARMLDKLVAWQQEGGLLVTDTAGAKDLRAEADAEKAAAQQAHADSVQSLQQQLDALDTEIAQVEASWEWEN